MNLIKAAELLKGAPDAELTQYLQNPTGDFPEYLVASEIKRRETMREKYAAANQGQPTKTSIIEELLQKDNQQMRQQQPQMPQQMPPEAMGLGAVPPPQGMQLTPSPIMEAAQQQPQQFYHGGVVALAEGGSLEDAIQEYLRPHMYEGKGMQSAGINPSIPVGAGSMDLSAAYNRMGDGVPLQSNVTGRIGGSYPMGEGRLSAGIQGIHAPGYSGVTGYDVGYSDEKNRLMANINPTPHGAALGASYGRRLDDDSSIDARLMRDPRGHMSGNLMYTRHFAQGGLAGEINDYLHGYAIGGAVDPYKLPDWVTQQQQVPESMTHEQAFNMAEQQMGPSAFEGSDTTINERQKRLEENRKNYLSDFLIHAGLGMTKSKGNFFQAAAEGAAQGFDYHQKAKIADEEAQRQLEDSKLKIKAGQRAEKAGLIGLSNQFYTSAEAAKDRAVDNNRQSAFLGLQAAQARDTAGYHAKMADASMAQVAKAAEANRLTAQYRQDALEAQKADRLENRKIKALEIRTKLMKARNDFQNDVINNPMSDYAQKVKALSKQYTGYTLERAKADLLKSARNSYGLDDLEAALTDYQS